MSEKEKEVIHFEEKEYRQLEAIAKKTGFKDVDELVNTAISNFIENYLIEKDEVTVKVPKKLLAFLKVERKDNLIEFLSNLLTDSIAADIEAEVYGFPEDIKTEYGLKEEFQFYQGH